MKSAINNGKSIPFVNGAIGKFHDNHIYKNGNKNEELISLKQRIIFRHFFFANMAEKFCKSNLEKRQK